jgi:hypothetical protein
MDSIAIIQYYYYYNYSIKNPDLQIGPTPGRGSTKDPFGTFFLGVYNVEENDLPV